MIKRFEKIIIALNNFCKQIKDSGVPLCVCVCVCVCVWRGGEGEGVCAWGADTPPSKY